MHIYTMNILNLNIFLLDKIYMDIFKSEDDSDKQPLYLIFYFLSAMRRVTAFCVLVASVLILVHGARSEHVFCQNDRLLNTLEKDADNKPNICPKLPQDDEKQERVDTGIETVEVNTDNDVARVSTSRVSGRLGRRRRVSETRQGSRRDVRETRGQRSNTKSVSREARREIRDTRNRRNRVTRESRDISVTRVSRRSIRMTRDSRTIPDSGLVNTIHDDVSRSTSNQRRMSVRSRYRRSRNTRDIRVLSTDSIRSTRRSRSRRELDNRSRTERSTRRQVTRDTRRQSTRDNSLGRRSVNDKRRNSDVRRHNVRRRTRLIRYQRSNGECENVNIGSLPLSNDIQPVSDNGVLAINSKIRMCSSRRTVRSGVRRVRQTRAYRRNTRQTIISDHPVAELTDNKDVSILDSDTEESQNGGGSSASVGTALNVNELLDDEQISVNTDQNTRISVQKRRRQSRRRVDDTRNSYRVRSDGRRSVSRRLRQRDSRRRVSVNRESAHTQRKSHRASRRGTSDNTMRRSRRSSRTGNYGLQRRARKHVHEDIKITQVRRIQIRESRRRQVRYVRNARRISAEHGKQDIYASDIQTFANRSPSTDSARGRLSVRHQSRRPSRQQRSRESLSSFDLAITVQPIRSRRRSRRGHRESRNRRRVRYDMESNTHFENQDSVEKKVILLNFPVLDFHQEPSRKSRRLSRRAEKTSRRVGHRSRRTQLSSNSNSAFIATSKQSSEVDSTHQNDVRNASVTTDSQHLSQARQRSSGHQPENNGLLDRLLVSIPS